MICTQKNNLTNVKMLVGFYEKPINPDHIGFFFKNVPPPQIQLDNIFSIAEKFTF